MGSTSSEAEKRNPRARGDALEQELAKRMRPRNTNPAGAACKTKEKICQKTTKLTAKISDL
jgi:hypothetical protein